MCLEFGGLEERSTVITVQTLSQDSLVNKAKNF